MQRETLLTPADARVLRTMYQLDGICRWPTLKQLAELSELSEGTVSASLRHLDALRFICTPRRGALRSEGVAFTTHADSRRVRREVARLLREDVEPEGAGEDAAA